MPYMPLLQRHVPVSYYKMCKINQNKCLHLVDANHDGTCWDFT